MPDPNPNTDQPQDPTEDNTNNQNQDAKKKRTGPKRRKVTHGKLDGILVDMLDNILTDGQCIACVYCRRSHMTCDEGKAVEFGRLGIE